jgi:predicted acylesterase/phospholipase RssA/CRP-like cAMP-binding protein
VGPASNPDGGDARADGDPVVDRAAVGALLRESEVFGTLPDDVRSLLLDELRLRTAQAGDVVIRQGDPADGLYVVAGGRLQVVYDREDGEQVVLREEGYGAVTGEMALDNPAPRSANVVALRECHLLFLPYEGFQRVIAAHPEALRSITSVLVRKLAATARGRLVTSPVRSIVVLPLDAGGPAEVLVRALAPTIERLVDAHRVVTVDDQRAELGTDPTALARVQWFERLEATFDAVVFVAHSTPDDWTRACLDHADVVLAVAEARVSPALRPIEDLLDRPGRPSRTELVLVHAPRTEVPRNTRRWLAPRVVRRHHHVRAGDDDDAARVARLVLNRGVGVVFGGGGARGIAHIGVLRALEAHNVPIDATGGTSIGSIIAGAVARGLDSDHTAALLRTALVEGKSPIDLTLPALSLAAGARVTERIQDGADGLDLEDTWRPTFCVSTNLTTGRLEIHRDGPGWKAIRASFAVPGVFPPVPNSQGEVLVDGGLLDNMPVTPMRRAHAGIRVVAIDVGAAREPLSAPMSETGVVSGWNYAWSQLRTRSYGNLASLPRILMRLTELGAGGNDDRGDLYLRPRTDAVSLMDFKAFDELIEIGRRDSDPEIAKWLGAETRY